MPKMPSAGSRPLTSPLLRIAFNPVDNTYMPMLLMDGSGAQMDMKSPGSPVMELRRIGRAYKFLWVEYDEWPTICHCRYV